MINPIALQLFPPDAPLSHIPVCVLWDGNCLFRAASLLLTGCERSSHKFLRLQMAKELAQYNEYYLGVHVLSGRTGKLNKKTSTPSPPLLCLARCLITQAIKYLVNITKMAEAFHHGSELEHDIPSYP